MSVRLDIRVRPRASANRIAVSDGGEVRVYVTAAPESGNANSAAITLVGKALGVPESSIAIVRGRASRDKALEIHGVESVVEAVERLRAWRP